MTRSLRLPVLAAMGWAVWRGCGDGRFWKGLEDRVNAIGVGKKVVDGLTGRKIDDPIAPAKSHRAAGQHIEQLDERRRATHTVVRFNVEHVVRGSGPAPALDEDA